MSQVVETKFVGINEELKEKNDGSIRNQVLSVGHSNGVKKSLENSEEMILEEMPEKKGNICEEKTQMNESKNFYIKKIYYFYFVI